MPILLPPPILTGLIAVNRLYLANAAPTFLPTMKGVWNGGSAHNKLSRIPEGTDSFYQIDETASVDVAYVASAWITEPLLTPVTISGTFDICVGVMEVATTADARTRIYLYVTQGNTNSVRGVLANILTVGAEWSTTVQGWAHTAQALSSVAALTGDRVVLEFGTVFTNTTGVSQSSRVYYGNTGAVDLSNGDTAITTHPGWIYFNSVALPVGA